MYNRYIPNPDGSYARNRIPDNTKNVKQDHSASFEQHQHLQNFTANDRHFSGNSLSFIKQLFGSDFDMGDLIVILLLLLMAGDSKEDRNNALLTIALYFIL